MDEMGYKALKVARLADRAGVHQPYLYSPGPVRLDSPAAEVMTDLKMVAAATVDAETQIDAANQLMIARGVRSLIVIDSRQEVLGLVTSRDIHGERPLRAVQARGVTHGELRVGDVMTPSRDIEVLDAADVFRADVGNILATLKLTGRQHALVVDKDAGGRQKVRGVFSLSQIARQLGVPIQHTELARTFAEIESALVAAV